MVPDENGSSLGKETIYPNQYDPTLLFPIARSVKRKEIGIINETILPFSGHDIWNGYELSWLNAKGKPVVAHGEFFFSCTSPCIIESKSFKLYLNSFNNSSFASLEEVQTKIIEDLSHACGEEIRGTISCFSTMDLSLNTFSGIVLDTLDISCDMYNAYPEYLVADTNIYEEKTYVSHLLKSNCLITNQPDWGSLQITYAGPRIDPEGLLKYIVSLRNHNEFHEQCVERIFMNILKYCAPKKLSVYARYTRRGGLDINPYRSNISSKTGGENYRLIRQ